MGGQWGTEADGGTCVVTLASPKLPSKWSDNLYHCSVYPRLPHSRPTLDSLLAIIYVINTWPRQRRAEWLRIRGGRRGKCIFSSKILSLPYLKVSPLSCMKDGQQCGHTAIGYLPYEKLRLSTGGVRCWVIYDAGALYLYGPPSIWFSNTDPYIEDTSEVMKSPPTFPLLVSFTSSGLQHLSVPMSGDVMNPQNCIGIFGVK